MPVEPLALEEREQSAAGRFPSKRPEIIMSHLIQIVIVVGITFGTWYFLKSRPTFIIVIRQGRPSVFKGTVLKKLLNEIEEICSQFKIESGRISGFTTNGRVTLTFHQISTEHHQRFRNILNIYR